MKLSLMYLGCTKHVVPSLGTARRGTSLTEKGDVVVKVRCGIEPQRKPRQSASIARPEVSLRRHVDFPCSARFCVRSRFVGTCFEGLLLRSVLRGKGVVACDLRFFCLHPMFLGYHPCPSECGTGLFTKDEDRGRLWGCCRTSLK